jgi:lycopene cyclase domain-containing protein
MYTYLLVILFSISLPFILSFTKKYPLRKNWTELFPAIALTGIFFIVWDILFTELGVWGFNERYLVGLDIINLPLEEWLFFIVIPYACMFTYFAFNKISKKTFLDKYVSGFTSLLAGFLITTAILNTDKLYTSVTFLLTGIFLLVHVYLLKSDYLELFYRAYLFVFLFPFLIVNGILTGSFIEDQVVWYNNFENLSTRVFTIPLEDFFYGMFLFLMNVTLYEYFLRRKNKLNSKLPA